MYRAVSQPSSSLSGARPRYALCHKWLCAEMNPGIIHSPAASYVVVADKPDGGEPGPIAVMVSSFPTTMYPVKGFSCPGTMVKRSAFVMSSFACGAWVWATLNCAQDNERTRMKKALVS